MRKALMLGAGTCEPARRLRVDMSEPPSWTTLDINPSGNPDYIFDLEQLEDGIDLPGGPYDEVHAYDVLEHFGRQGDYRGFFSTFKALHRALVPGGLLVGTCPARDSVWVWGDPGHTRTIQPQTIAYLVKDHYKQLGRTRCTDYRYLIEPYWWEINALATTGGTFEFALNTAK